MNTARQEVYEYPSEVRGNTKPVSVDQHTLKQKQYLAFISNLHIGAYGPIVSTEHPDAILVRTQWAAYLLSAPKENGQRVVLSTSRSQTRINGEVASLDTRDTLLYFRGRKSVRVEEIYGITQETQDRVQAILLLIQYPSLIGREWNRSFEYLWSRWSSKSKN